MLSLVEIPRETVQIKNINRLKGPFIFCLYEYEISGVLTLTWRVSISANSAWSFRREDPVQTPAREIYYRWGKYFDNLRRNILTSASPATSGDRPYSFVPPFSPPRPPVTSRPPWLRAIPAVPEKPTRPPLSSTVAVRTSSSTPSTSAASTSTSKPATRRTSPGKEIKFATVRTVFL